MQLNEPRDIILDSVKLLLPTRSRWKIAREFRQLFHLIYENYTLINQQITSNAIRFNQSQTAKRVIGKSASCTRNASSAYRGRQGAQSRYWMALVRVGSVCTPQSKGAFCAYNQGLVVSTALCTINIVRASDRTAFGKLLWVINFENSSVWNK